MIDHGDGARAGEGSWGAGFCFLWESSHHTIWVRISSMMEKTTLLARVVGWSVGRSVCLSYYEMEIEQKESRKKRGRLDSSEVYIPCIHNLCRPRVVDVCITLFTFIQAQKFN